MIKVIMGLKGSGKTKQLIDIVNSAVETESGSVICIERGPKLTYDIDYRVRLIDAGNYLMGSYRFLKGFISGLQAGNFDITHIFIDSLYKVAGSDTEVAVTDFLEWADEFGKVNNIDFTITISADEKTAPESIRKFF